MFVSVEDVFSWRRSAFGSARGNRLQEKSFVTKIFSSDAIEEPRDSFSCPRMIDESSSVLFSAEPEVDWTALFADARPVEIEIGCGKGAFLLAYATLHADTSLLGIERQLRWVRQIEARLERAPLDN